MFGGFFLKNDILDARFEFVDATRVLIAGRTPLASVKKWRGGRGFVRTASSRVKSTRALRF